MTIRITQAQVLALITTDKDVGAFILTANIIVNEHLISSGLSNNMLAQIELYLAAHITALVVEKGGLVRNSIGDSADSYANVYKAGFSSTRFGQQAMTLDSTGTLASLNSNSQKLKARLTLV